MHVSSSRTLLPAVLLGLFAASSALGQEVSEETVEYFRTNCASCHTIGGGKLAGPDLAGSTERKDVDWLTDFVLDPKAVIDSGDPYAQALLRDARGIYMPAIPGLTRDRARKLVELIAVESAKETSQFAGTQISERPLTQADVRRGERLFAGRERFAAGGPSCLSCHQAATIGSLGGGLLGPDLTSAFSRLEGRKALAAWLSAPPSATMQPIYKARPLEGDEILALVAWLKDSAESGAAPPTARGSLPFLLWGIGGVVLLLGAFDLIWRRRLRGVRRTLVGSTTR